MTNESVVPKELHPFAFKDKLNNIKINREISNIVADHKSGNISNLDRVMERLEILQKQYPNNKSLMSKIEHIKLTQVALMLPKILEIHTMSSNNRTNSSSAIQKRLKEFTPDVEDNSQIDNQSITPSAITPGT